MAWSLPPEERFAYLVVFGELDGNEFDWVGLRWRERER